MLPFQMMHGKRPSAEPRPSGRGRPHSLPGAALPLACLLLSTNVPLSAQPSGPAAAERLRWEQAHREVQTLALSEAVCAPLFATRLGEARAATAGYLAAVAAGFSPWAAERAPSLSGSPETPVFRDIEALLAAENAESEAFFDRFQQFEPLLAPAGAVRRAQERARFEWRNLPDVASGMESRMAPLARHAASLREVLKDQKGPLRAEAQGLEAFYALLEEEAGRRCSGGAATQSARQPPTQPASAAPAATASLQPVWAAELRGWRSLAARMAQAIFDLPPGEALALVEEAASSRRRLSEAKRNHAAALARQYRTFARIWQAPDRSDPPAEAGLRAAIAAAVEDLDRQLKELPNSRRRFAPFLERQRTELQSVQNGLTARLEARSRHDAGAPEIDAAVESLLAFANRFDNHQETLRQEAAAWDRVHQALKDEVARRAPAVPAAESPAQAESAAAPGLAGSWFMMNLNARKTEEGAYEPRFIHVRIRQQGDRLEGSYEALYAVPEDEPHNPAVRFSFEGGITGEPFRFPLSAPLRGAILIAPAGPDRIRVSYEIENPDVRNISFAAVSPANPQSLQRKTD